MHITTILRTSEEDNDRRDTARRSYLALAALRAFLAGNHKTARVYDAKNHAGKNGCTGNPDANPRIHSGVLHTTNQLELLTGKQSTETVRLNTLRPPRTPGCRG